MFLFTYLQNNEITRGLETKKNQLINKQCNTITSFTMLLENVSLKHVLDIFADTIFLH